MINPKHFDEHFHVARGYRAMFKHTNLSTRRWVESNDPWTAPG